MYLRGAKTIMVIDDDDDSRRILVQWLHANDFSPMEAVNGDGALVMLRAAPSSVDAILLDLEMPRVNGETFRALQLADSRIAHIPVLVVSGHHDAQRAAARMGATLVRKPLDLDALRRVLRHLEIHS